MKILQIVPRIVDEASGPSYSVVRLCDQLIEHGAAVELCTLQCSGDRLPAYNREFAPSGPVRKIGMSRDMKRYVVRGSQPYDVVHVNGLWMMPGIYGASAAVRRGIPLVSAPRGSLSGVALATGSRLKPVFWKLLQRRALERAHLFHATSAAEAADIRNMGFRQPIATIPNGIDVPEIRRELSASGRTLLYLGRVHPIKGLPMLLEAWRELSVRHPEWSLSIVGPGEPQHVREVRQLAADLDLPRVSFAAPAFGPEKWRRYASADLFVLPSHSENFGMTVAESLAAGTPVVTTRGAPWSGVVGERCGWWCDTGSAALHDALTGAMNLPRNTLESMGENGRSWMRREFSWAGIATRMHDGYRWIRSGGEQPAWIS
jgi:glycosyltransferase involved in cell wall biosynthesis